MQRGPLARARCWAAAWTALAWLPGAQPLMPCGTWCALRLQPAVSENIKVQVVLDDAATGLLLKPLCCCRAIGDVRMSAMQRDKYFSGWALWEGPDTTSVSSG